MSVIRLVQDQPQANQASRTAGERLAQDAAQASQSERIDREKERKRLKELEEEKEAKKKLKTERANVIYYQIPKFEFQENVTTIHKGGRRTKSKGNVKKQYATYKKKWGAKIKSNQETIAKFGKQWKVSGSGGHGRTVSRILRGEVAGKGRNATEIRQVATQKNADSWNEGRITWGAYLQRKENIEREYQERRKKETSHRNWRSTKAAQGKATAGVQQNFIPGGQFSIQESSSSSLPSIQSTNTGSGTSVDPFKATQPDRNKVSPYLKAYQSPQSLVPVTGGSFIGYSPGGKPIQGPPRPPQYTVTDSKGKVRTFNTLESANKFATRVQTTESLTGVIGSLEAIYGKRDTNNEPEIEISAEDSNRIWDNRRYDDIRLAAQAGFSNALRYADAVDLGEVPKPTGLQLLPYYASHGVKPITDIVFHVDNLIRGTEHRIAPTLSDKITEVPISLATKGKTDTHDPVGDYIREDPIRTAIQLPAEGALWITGGKVAQTAAKVTSKVSPVAVQTLKFPIQGEMKTVYKGVTIKDRPIIGVQEGKIVTGIRESHLPFDAIDTSKFGRYGWEPVQSQGIASKTVFSEKSLDSMVKHKVITPLSKERIQTGKDLFESTKGTKTKVGKFSAEPVKDLTQTQSDYLLHYSAKGQKTGRIEAFHGSTALQSQISPSLRAKAGSHLRMGDLDITVKAKTDVKQERIASQMIREIGEGFPLEKGQTLRISDSVGKLKANKELFLTGKDGKERKILEIVLEERDASGIVGLQVRTGEKIFGEFITGKTVKTKDFGLKVHERRFQQQENIRTVFQFHKGIKGTKFDVYPAEGRTKDVVRSYWNFKEDALRVGGRKGKIIDTKAEKYRSLYKEINFEDLPTEKIDILSPITKSPSPSALQSFAGEIPSKGHSVLASTLLPKTSSSVQISSSPEQPRLKTSSKTDVMTSKKIPSVKNSIKSPLKTSESISSPKSKVPAKNIMPSSLPSKTSSKRTKRAPLYSSLTSPSPKTPSSRTLSPKSSKSPKGSNVQSPASTKSSIVGSSTKFGSRIAGFSGTHGTDPFRTSRKPIPLYLIDSKNRTKKKKAKKKKPHDFLGNMRLDQIEGMFRRTEVIHGDRRLPKQIRHDKTKGFTSSKVKIF